MKEEDRREFICPLDVGMFGNIAQFLIRDCQTREEAIEKLRRLGIRIDEEAKELGGKDD